MCTHYTQVNAPTNPRCVELSSDGLKDFVCAANFTSENLLNLRILREKETAYLSIFNDRSGLNQLGCKAVRRWQYRQVADWKQSKLTPE